MILPDGLSSIRFYQRLLPGESTTTHPVAAELRRKGYSVEVTGDGEYQASFRGIVWIQGNLRWYPSLYRQLLSTSGERRPFIVYWLHEPLPMPAKSGFGTPRLGVREIAKIILRDWRRNDVYSNRQTLQTLASRNLPDQLIVSTHARQQYLDEMGIKSTWCPLGVCIDTDRSDYQGERDIDVLFLGVPTGRRRRQLKQLSRLGAKIQVAGGWSDSRFWGTERAHLIARSKVFLNVSHFAGELPGLRFALGMVNRSLILSEPVYLPAPFEPGHHYVSADLRAIPEMITYYLSHEREREQLTSSAYDLASTQLTWEKSVSRILKVLQTR